MHLINRLPSTAIAHNTPHTLLFLTPTTYHHLRVFGCLCYPNVSSITPHKLSPRSTPCVFLGFSPSHKRYRCLNLSTHKIIIPRHVTFDEATFPFSCLPHPSNHNYTFLYSDDGIPLHILHPQKPPPPPREPDPPIPHIANQPHPPEPAEPIPSATNQPTSPTTNLHPMTARAKSGIHKPKQLLNLHTSHISPIPSTYKQALQDPNWTAAMCDEFSALINTGTWDLVPRSCATNIISGKWIFRHKFHSDGSLACFKVHWVVRGFHQQYGVDFTETFSLVVKPATIRTVLSLALSRSWPIRQLVVKNAFLHGDLAKTVYCEQSPSFIDSARPTHACRLKKALYGLKQAPRAWYQPW